MIDFGRVKAAVRIVDVCAKYGIQLRFRGDWGSAKCPLPTHKEGEKDKTFQVNIPGNYWKCWSASCNDNAGKKGGDVINFVALMDNCSEYDAAKKLIEWFHLDNKKPAQPIAKRGSEKPPKGSPQKDFTDHTNQSASVKGYMSDVDAWFNELFARRETETDDDYWKRTKNGVKARLVLSFRNGKRVAAGLPPESV